MTVSIFSPFPRFDDTDGQPLDGGFIYIGVANTDPFSNRVDVYSNAALSVALAQPLRTSGGFIVDGSGTPINVYTAADFSISVRNRLNVEIYSLASYGFRIFADAITVDTLTVNTSIIPGAAGGATNGTSTRPWTRVTSRDVHTKQLSVYSQAQPTVSADLGKITQRMLPLCAVEQTSSTATPAWINGLNVNTAGCSRLGSAGLYEVAFSVALPSAQFWVVVTPLDSVSVGREFLVTNRTASKFQVNMSLAGVATDMPFSAIVFGNPAVADPIS
jgi:hypothetical protein